MSTLRINEDNDVLLSKLRDAYSGTYVNNATVTAVVKTLVGAVLVPSFALDYQAGTDGEYLGILDKGDAANLVDGTAYHVEVTITASPYDGFRRFRATAIYHGATP